MRRTCRCSPEKLFEAYYPICFHSTQKASKSFAYTPRGKDAESAPIAAKRRIFLCFVTFDPSKEMKRMNEAGSQNTTIFFNMTKVRLPLGQTVCGRLRPSEG